ncbi:MAG: cation diffusion facilitator family transporter [Candidatus Aminicenantes bacterium]|nr:cation diffusion facilitator family transporter [Candidatus Aminicenantes bacterium]
MPNNNPPYLKVGIYSLLVNLTLAAVKLILSFVTGSLALRADAIHSSVDVFGSIALIVGLVISNRKTSKFPYGLYKMENVVSVIISLLLFVTAYELISEAVKGETTTVPYRGGVLGIVGALVLVPFIFSRYEIKVGKRYHSPSLIADGKQFRADVLSASIVFFALLAQYFGFPLDRIAAGIVTLFIVYAGWGLLSDSMRVLLDASVNRETLDQIRSTIEAEPAVSTVKSVTGRNSGRFMFVEADIKLRTKNLTKAHQISERLEKTIKEKECCVDRMLIHYEPETKIVYRYVFPVTGPDKKIGKHFGESPQFMLVDIDTTKKKIERQNLLDNPYFTLEKGKGIKVAQLLLEHNPDVVYTREDLSGKGPGYAFADAGVETRQTTSRNAEELLDHLLSGSEQTSEK